MKYLSISTFYLIALCTTCSAEEFLYQYFNGSTKSLEYYCVNYRLLTLRPEDFSVPSLVELTDVKQLKIRGCDYNAVTNAIETCPNVLSLDISYCDYRSLGSVHFRAEQLKTFNASFNWLAKIPWFYLKQMPKVIEIDFSYNELGRINSFDFEGAYKLKRIHLSHNKINLISYHAFENLTNLEYVDLSSNEIAYGIEAFQNNKHLKVLDLRENPFWSITCDYFLEMHPISVFISFQYIQLIHFSCNGNPLRVISNGKTEGILSTSIGKYEIHCNEESFENVHTLIAERIEIKNIAELIQSLSSSLVILSINDSFIGKLNATKMRQFIRLREITLMRTNLAQFDIAMLENHKQLDILDISYNNLKRLNHISLLDTFKHLKQFAAVENQFEHIDEIVHRLPSSIESLDLSGNFVGNLNPASFYKFKNLLVLNLSNTSLTITDSNPFEDLKNVTILDLSDNDLRDVDLSILSTTLNHISIFYATDCHIQDISELVQYFGPSLTRLYLSGNIAGNLTADTFKMLDDLHYLHLDNTNISHIESNTLQHQIKLTELNLSNNQLREIDLGLISEKLTTLHLNGNNLMEIKNLTRLRFPMLLTLDISNNRLPCAQLVNFVREWNGRFVSDPWNQNNDENCHQKDFS